jgi:hypothetical protein
VGRMSHPTLLAIAIGTPLSYNDFMVCATSL